MLKRGFSLLEVSLVIFFLGIILLLVFRFNSNLFGRYEDYQEITQIKAIEDTAIRYVNKNYLDLIKQSTDGADEYGNAQHIYLNPLDYAPNNLSKMVTRYKQIGCLDIVAVPLGVDNNNKSFQIKLDVTLFIGDYGNKYKRLEDKKAGYIFSKLGGIAGIVKESGGEYTIEGNLFNSHKLGWMEVGDISSLCGFSDGLKSNNFALKLSDDRRLLVEQKSPLMDVGKDLFVERYRIKSQKSNLYFDNVVRESSDPGKELHSYRGIDFGVDANNNRIVLHNDESIGYANSGGNTLTLSNAGIVVGKVKFKSESIEIGRECLPTELGRTYREPIEETVIDQSQPGSSTLSGGTLICRYNIIFCPTKYCYLPEKGITLKYTFSKDRSSYTCPGIMRLAPSLNGFIDTKIRCPERDGYDTDGLPHQKLSDCFTKYGADYCKTFGTVCTYRSNSNPRNMFDALVPALSYVKCTNDFNYIIINNYKYTGD